MHHRLKISHSISRIRFMRVLVRLVKNCVYFSYEKRKNNKKKLKRTRSGVVFCALLLQCWIFNHGHGIMCTCTIIFKLHLLLWVKFRYFERDFFNLLSFIYKNKCSQWSYLSNRCCCYCCFSVVLFYQFSKWFQYFV